jgi:hypothetical protein
MIPVKDLTVNKGVRSWKVNTGGRLDVHELPARSVTEVTLAYGGGEHGGATVGTRTRLNELEFEGFELLRTLRARLNSEVEVG